MRISSYFWLVVAVLILLGSNVGIGGDDHRAARIDQQLRAVLQQAGFSGNIESTLTTRLGRTINPQLADLGRLLFFDNSGGLHFDNTCGGCHSPSTGLGDTQSIAIGVQNNRIVGPSRLGPRNQRRTPSAANTTFLPKPDVERTLFRAFRRAVQQLPGIPIPFA